MRRLDRQRRHRRPISGAADRRCGRIGWCRSRRTWRRAGGPRVRGRPCCVDPDPRWPGWPRSLAARISAAAGGRRSTTSDRPRSRDCPAKDVIDLQLVVPDLATADAIGRAAGAPPGSRALPGSDLDNAAPDPGSARVDAGRLGQATARQRRPRAPCQPPLEGEGFAGLAVGRAVSGLASRRSGSPGEYLRSSGPGGRCLRPMPAVCAGEGAVVTAGGTPRPRDALGGAGTGRCADCAEASRASDTVVDPVRAVPGR